MFVLYMFAGFPGLVVFASTSRTSGYKYVGRSASGYQPPGHISWDHSLSIIDGKGYKIYGSWNLSSTMRSPTSIWPPFLQTVFIEQLTDDYLNGTGTAYPVVTDPASFPITQNSPSIVDALVEAPALFKRGDFFCQSSSIPSIETF